MTSSSNKEIKAIHPPNLGWLEYRLNEEEMKHVRECISKAHVDFKPKLAGNIHGSYVLEDEGDWFWNNTLKVLCTTYQEAFKINLGDLVPTGQGYPYFLQTWWVNYQKQTDFNPLHHHDGVYSFALWMDIPFRHFEQNKKPEAMNSNTPCVSNFEFAYINIMGEVQTYGYELNPKDSGRMVFFPSKLKHMVYPFYNCDKERVSISGNIVLNTLGPGTLDLIAEERKKLRELKKEKDKKKFNHSVK